MVRVRIKRFARSSESSFHFLFPLHACHAGYAPRRCLFPLSRCVVCCQDNIPLTLSRHVHFKKIVSNLSRQRLWVYISMHNGPIFVSVLVTCSSTAAYIAGYITAISRHFFPPSFFDELWTESFSAKKIIIC